MIHSHKGLLFSTQIISSLSYEFTPQPAFISPPLKESSREGSPLSFLASQVPLSVFLDNQTPIVLFLFRLKFCGLFYPSPSSPPPGLAPRRFNSTHFPCPLSFSLDSSFYCPPPPQAFLKCLLVKTRWCFRLCPFLSIVPSQHRFLQNFRC